MDIHSIMLFSIVKLVNDSFYSDEEVRLAIKALLNRPVWDNRQIDPPNCGCTECITGEYVNAVNDAHYELYKEIYG